jgi:cellulose synthase (UDP-forming)
MFFIPYLLLSMAVFLGTLHQRGYRFTDLFQGIVLNAITFPVFMKASLLAMIGVRGTFGITPKGQSLALPLGGLVPQIALAAASFAAIVWGLHRLVFEGSPAAAIVVNCLWCLYHFIILSCVLYFNHPEES